MGRKKKLLASWLLGLLLKEKKQSKNSVFFLDKLFQLHFK
jgi:hypothetical protein